MLLRTEERHGWFAPAAGKGRQDPPAARYNRGRAARVGSGAPLFTVQRLQADVSTPRGVSVLDPPGSSTPPPAGVSGGRRVGARGTAVGLLGVGVTGPRERMPIHTDLTTREGLVEIAAVEIGD